MINITVTIDVMISSGAFEFDKNNNKQSLKIYPGTQTNFV
jgi:hypothetical protein